MIYLFDKILCQVRLGSMATGHMHQSAVSKNQHGGAHRFAVRQTVKLCKY